MINEYFQIVTNRPTISAELDPTDGCHVFRISSVPPVARLQEDLALTVGDCVHNIRSALDHLVYELAYLFHNGKLGLPHRLQFPIVDSPQDFPKEAKRWLKELHSDHLNLIEKYQPYHGLAGRPDSWSGPYVHQLTLLKQLSNVDKHRLLNTVLLLPSGAEFHLPLGAQIRWPEITSVDDFLKANPARNAGNELRVGVEIYRAELFGPSIPAAIPQAGYVTPHVALEENRPLAATLERIEKYAELVVRDFQQTALITWHPAVPLQKSIRAKTPT